MTTRLRGRDGELAALAERLGDAVAGHGSVTIVEGAAGIGKSRLVEEAVAIARRNGVRVAAATAASPGETTPLGVVLRALVPLVGDLDVERGRLWVLQELEARLEAEALRAPLLIALDDLHWADPHSVAAIATLADALAALPVVWIVALRPAEVVLPGELLVLSPLDPEAIDAVVRDTVGAQPGPRLSRAAAGTGGNAHALGELLAGAVEEELLAREDGVVELASEALPSRVREHMRERLARLPEAGRATVEGAAIFGRRSEIAAVAALLERDHASPAVAADALGDLVAVEGEEFVFAHDLVHAAVLDTVAGRAALEREAVEVLLARGASPAAVGARLAAVAEPGDRRATALLLDAARELGPTDPAAAVELSRRGYTLCADDDPSRPGLAAETTLLLNAANRGDEGRRFAAATLDGLLSVQDQAEVLLKVAWMFTISPADQVAAAEQALALEGLPDALRARAYAALIISLGTAGRSEDAERILPDALAAGTRAGGIHASFDNATAEGFVLLGTGRYTEAMVLIEAGIAAADGDPMQLWLFQHWRSDVLVLLDRTDEAMPLLVQEVTRATRTGQAWDAQLYEQRRGRLLLLCGRTLEGLAALEGLYDARDGFDVTGPDATAIVGLGRAALHAADSGQTRVTGALARKMLGAAVPEVRRQGALLMLLQALADERDDTIEEALTVLDGAMPTILVDPAIGPYVVRAALRVGDRASAEQALRWQERLADVNPGVASMAGAALHARALLDGGPLEPAVAALRASPRPPLLASALEDLGARTGDTDALDEAFELWNSFGSGWDAARVRRRLRRLGVRRRPAAAARTSEWEQLTPSELAVARLVASGVTNREAAERLFLSPHTVSTHLRHAFTKLGIRSRVQLVRLVAEHEGAAELPWDELTPAQRRVAELVAEGLSNQEVAERLVVSSHTVATHLRHAYVKLGVRTRTELSSRSR